MVEPLEPRGELTEDEETGLLQRLSSIRRYGEDVEKGDESEMDKLGEEEILKLLLDKGSFASKDEIDEAIGKIEQSETG